MCSPKAIQIKDTLHLLESIQSSTGVMNSYGNLSENFVFHTANCMMKDTHPWVTERTQKRMKPYMTNKQRVTSKHTWLRKKWREIAGSLKNDRTLINH